MSSLVYPSTLPGLTFDNVRTPVFKTGIQEAISGKESRISYMQYPRFTFELQYDWLDDRAAVSHLKTLAGLFMQMKGRFDTFLFTDPTFNAVTTNQFGTGDGVTTAFQLTATWQNSGGPGVAELVQNLNGTPQIYKAAVLQSSPSQYSIGPTGIVTFVSAPAGGNALTWTGSFYYRCRFVDDDMSVTQFMKSWWKTGRVRFKSVKL